MRNLRVRLDGSTDTTAEGLGLLSRGDGLDGEITGVGLGRVGRCIRICACGHCYASARLARRHWCGNRALARDAAIRSGEPARDLRPGRRSGGGMPMHYRLERLVSLGRRTFRLWRRVESGELSARLGRYRPDAIARAVRRVWGLLLGLPILSD